MKTEPQFSDEPFAGVRSASIKFEALDFFRANVIEGQFEKVEARWRRTLIAINHRLKRCGLFQLSSLQVTVMLTVMSFVV